MPVSEPFGIVIVTGPVTVGTGTRAPSTASARLTGSSTMDVVALAAEERMRRDMDLDQRVARRAAAETRARPCP